VFFGQLQAVPLWLVAVIGLAIGAAVFVFVFVFVDHYPRLPRGRWCPQAILIGGGRVLLAPELEAISRVAGPGCAAGAAWRP
jgi:hypothetical protein